jgi:hypothetical protein
MFSTEPTARAALRPSSTRERRIALAVALVLSAALLCWAAFGSRPLPYSPPFFSAHVTALSLGMLFAAVLLVFRARLVGDGSRR